MPKPTAKQAAAFEALRTLDPHLTIEWDEDSGTPTVIRGILSPPSPAVGAQSVSDAAHEAAYAFMRRNKELYRVANPDKEFPRSRVVSDEAGSTVRLYQLHEGVEVYDGELAIALDRQNRVTQALGRYRPNLRLSTEPVVPAAKAIDIARANLEFEDRDVEPVTHRLLVLNTAAFPTLVEKLGTKNLLAWRVELLSWVTFVNARDGSVIFSYDNAQTARNRETYATKNCRLLPGALMITESGAAPGQTPDEVAWGAHNNAGAVYDYYFGNFGLDSFDGRGHEMVSTVHSGLNNGFTCDHNNAAFIPGLLQVVYGDGDGTRFGPLGMALDVVGHEFTHAVVYFAITWSSGGPRGLDYRDESGALNESYADFFGAVIENKNWLMGEDCYTPKTPNDALRDMANPARYGQPDHYSGYVRQGTQSYMVHVNSGIMNKCAYLMSDGGTHHSVSVRAMGKENAAKIWYRALKHHLFGAATFKDAREAMLQSCQELFPNDGVKYSAVQNACAAVGIGDPAAPAPFIIVEPASIDFDQEQPTTLGAVAVGSFAERPLTVRNTGSADLAVSAMRSSDAAFSVPGEAAFQVAPGASQTVTVRFSPAGSGRVTANLTIQCNDPGRGTLTVPVSGTGIAPQIAVDPASLDFGSLSLGETAQRMLTVRNAGSADLTVSAVRCTSDAFVTPGEAPFEVPPQGSKALAIRFEPKAVGPQQAKLTIESDDRSQPSLSVPVSGAALGVPRIAVEPASLDWGRVLVGQSAQQALTVRNTGTADLSVAAVRCSNGAFTVGNGSAFVLKPAASRGLTVQFSPAAVGPQEGSLSIQSDDKAQPTVTVALLGTGIAPRIEIEPSSIDFGTLTLGQSSQRTLNLRSAGTADLLVAGVQSNQTVFSVLGETAFRVAPGASRVLTLQFAPTASGAQQAELSIRSNDADHPQVTVALAGVAQSLPEIVVDPATLDFGAVWVDGSGELPLSVLNRGGSPLLVSEMSIDHPAFVLAEESSFEVAAQGSRTLTVRFTPASEGAVQARLSLISNDPRRPALPVLLLGTGQPLPAQGPHIVLDVQQLDFGSVPVGQAAQRSLGVQNTGTEALAVKQMTAEGVGYGIVGEAAFEVQPGLARTVVLEYRPPAQGLQRGRLTVFSNDPQQPEASVTLVGAGTTCFVQTAAYGSRMQRDVRTLRDFRDHWLMDSGVGRGLVGLYYRCSGPVARSIAHSSTGRALARGLLWPAVLLARLLGQGKQT